MSGTITSIPASTIVSITPSVLSGGGSAQNLVGLFLTTSTRAPIGQVLSFPTAASVGSYFGFTSTEYSDALVYFSGFIGSNKLPGAMLFAQYPIANVGAYLRSGTVSGLTLSQLQALNGVLTITVDGTPHTSGTINLSAATSLSNAAQIITTAFGLTKPTQAVITATAGAAFTATSAGSVNLTVASVTGTLHVGDVLSGTGAGGVTIVSQTSGTTGAAGVYVTSASTTAAGVAWTAASTTLNVTAVASGALAVGQELVGTGLSAGTYITALGTGTGGVGTYILTAAIQNLLITSAVEPTVTYDSILGAFTFISGTTGANSTVGFATGTLATALKFTAATGAVTSQGAITSVPATFMAGIVAQTTNWCTLVTAFDPDAGSGNTQKLAFASWISSQNNQFLYAAWDTDPAATLSTAATSSFGYLVKAAAYSGTSPIYSLAGSNHFLAAFLAGLIASIDFTQFNGRATAAFKGQAGLVPTVTNATVAANLNANGYNYYADFATANQTFLWFMTGLVSGQYDWIDSYVNQIWLTNQMQLALMIMLGQYKSIPYNPAGYGLIRAALADPINAAVNFGAIRANVPLSAAQAAYVNNAVGRAVDGTLSSQGWYLEIAAATAQVRAARQSPPMTLFYMDGESVQSIQLASVLIQ